MRTTKQINQWIDEEGNGNTRDALNVALARLPDNTHTWGGKREGAGRPITHNDPTVKERTKKFRATDQEWAEFLNRLPKDSREAFQVLYRCTSPRSRDLKGA